MIGEIGLVFKKDQGWHEIVQFALFCLALFMLLIFTEIIEINACGLEKNTRKNIELRERLEEEDDNNDKNNINENSLQNKNTQPTKIEMGGVEIDLTNDGIFNEANIIRQDSNVSENDNEYY